MTTYRQFLGRKVRVEYRVADLLLPATGTLVGDSGRSIFLEQHILVVGKPNYFRWEIPYAHIHQLEQEVQPESARPSPVPVEARRRAAAAGSSDSQDSPGPSSPGGKTS